MAGAGKRRAAVVGGSVGGLFAANLLARRGWDVRVFERAAGPLHSRGAGIAMHAELDAVLSAAGALPAEAIGIRVDGRSAFGPDGRELARHQRDQYLTAWSRVYQPLRAAFPPERYHAAREVTAVDAAEGRAAVLCFREGEQAEADVVLGADGVRSTVRALFAPEATPRYAGYVAWRGMMDEAALSPRFREETFATFAFVFPGHGQLIGYPVAGADGSVEAGRRRYNFLWYYPVDEGEALADLFTDDSGRLHDGAIPPDLIRRAHLDRIRREARQRLPTAFLEPFEKTPQFLLQAVYDLESDRIVFGPVALLGDAAFVARPHLGVGVLKAAQDALALAECLDDASSIAAALARYERVRLGPGREAVRAARHLGSFIEHRLEAPWSDPALGLTPERLLELSARPPQRAAEAADILGGKP
jgi:2-polyprenyl-6-methoxyphenol hydroxylase-like FAD-dependent oxidoreductase